MENDQIRSMNQTGRSTLQTEEEVCILTGQSFRIRNHVATGNARAFKKQGLRFRSAQSHSAKTDPFFSYFRHTPSLMVASLSGQKALVTFVTL